MKEITNWYPMYAKDWITSIKLSLCSLEAKGLLVDLMCLSWENGNPGIITMPAKDIARFLRITEEKMEKLLEELISHGRIEKDGDLFDGNEIRIPKMIEIGSEQKCKHNKRVEAGRKVAEKRWADNSPSDAELIAKNSNANSNANGGAIAIEKSRIDKNREEEIRGVECTRPRKETFVGGQYRHYASQLINKLSFPRPLTKSEKARWERTLAHMLEDATGTRDNPVESVTDIFNRAMRDSRSKKWLAHPDYFLKDYGEFLDTPKPKKEAPPVFIQVGLLGTKKIYSQMFKDQKECDAFIEKNNLEIISGAGNNAIYGKRKETL